MLHSTAGWNAASAVMPLCYYSNVPPFRLDIRPYSRDIWPDIPLHITDSRSEEPPPLHNNHKWIRIMGGVLGAWIESTFTPTYLWKSYLKRKISFKAFNIEQCYTDSCRFLQISVIHFPFFFKEFYLGSSLNLPFSNDDSDLEMGVTLSSVL